MKATLFRSIVCASLIVFAGGCGKDNKSSGGTTLPNYQQNPYTGTVPVESQAAFNNFVNWYNSVNEGALPNLGITHYGELRVIQTLKQDCTTKNFNFWIIDKDFTFCKDANTETEHKRNVTIIGQGGSKTGNPKLAQALSGNGLTLSKASESTESYMNGSGKVFTLEYINTANGNRVIYVINTIYNSAFNPIQIINTETQTIESVVDINYPYPNI